MHVYMLKKSGNYMFYQQEEKHVKQKRNKKLFKYINEEHGIYFPKTNKGSCLLLKYE